MRVCCRRYRIHQHYRINRTTVSRHVLYLGLCLRFIRCSHWVIIASGEFFAHASSSNGRYRRSHAILQRSCLCKYTVLSRRQRLTSIELYGTSYVVATVRWLGCKNRFLLRSSSSTLYRARVVHCSRNNGTNIRRARRVVRATNTRLEIFERDHIFARSYTVGAR
jgi:hypothetical protein